MSEHEDWVSTGLPGLDHVLHGLRAGDNVVSQVESIAEYQPFVEAYVQEVLKAGKTLTYFRFARHPELVRKMDGIEIIRLNPEMGFESFLMEILDVVERRGLGADYLFDCLSDLAVDWYSDQMLANFFMITCPFLYRLDTIAYFAILRNRHISRTVESITNTAQVVIDVFCNRSQLYVQPLKVWQRYSPTMYMLHSWEGGRFRPVTNSAILSEILADLPKPWLDFRIHRPGVWTRTFTHAQETLAAVQSGKLTYWEADDCFHRLLRMALTRDERFIELSETYFQLEDLIDVFKRMIGTGLIGGKSLGMLLARAILLKSNPAWAERLEAHDSFFIGSDVFYTYLIQNDCWWLRREQRDEDNYLCSTEEARQRILAGEFPEHTRQQFVEMLNYFGQSPIIVRSSSLLEDNYGNAFSGKYVSVFCPNQGSPDDRLEAFMDAVREVYASAMSEDALNYRKLRGLLDRDEQMALLVQRVSGDVYGNHFFPQGAGVGYSFNPFSWSEDIDPDMGMLRLVAGLGTRAVDRVGGDYTRLVALSAPDRRPEDSHPDAPRHTQNQMDMLDLQTNSQTAMPVEDMAGYLPEHVQDMFFTYDAALARRARKHGVADVFARYISFDKLLHETEFIADMQHLLSALHDAYQNPVDVEFTLNFVGQGEYRINLVQCRPFQARIEGGGHLAKFPERVPDDHRLVETNGPIIGHSIATEVDWLIYIVPEVYSKLPVQKRYALARALGRVTAAAADNNPDAVIMLIGPGRWGTSSPSLGVPVSFNEISNVSIICELAVMHEGLIPDISLGTHFFNDLVELEMIYLAISPMDEGVVFHKELLHSLPNQLAKLCPAVAEWEDGIIVLNGESRRAAGELCLHADCVNQRGICYFKG